MWFSIRRTNMTYNFIISTQLTNFLQVLNYTDKFKPHPIEKTLTFEEINEKFSLTIKMPKSCRLRPSTVNLLNLRLIQFTQKPKATFDISLLEYMNFTGLKVRNRVLTEADKILKENNPMAFKKKDIESRKKKARKVISADIDTLSKITLQFNNKYQHLNSAIFSTLVKERNGDITGEFHPDFFRYLTKSNTQLMVYPETIAKTNCSRMKNPYLFAVKNKINQQCKFNLYDKKLKKKKDFFNISIETLLKICYMNGMNTPKELYQKYLDSGKNLKPHYKRDIAEVLYKTLEFIEKEENEFYSIEYLTHKKTGMYADNDTDKDDFYEWQRGFIKIIFKEGYPREEFDYSKIKKKTKKKSDSSE